MHPALTTVTSRKAKRKVLIRWSAVLKAIPTRTTVSFYFNQKAFQMFGKQFVGDILQWVLLKLHRSQNLSWNCFVELEVTLCILKAYYHTRLGSNDLSKAQPYICAYVT